MTADAAKRYRMEIPPVMVAGTAILLYSDARGGAVAAKMRVSGWAGKGAHAATARRGGGAFGGTVLAKFAGLVSPCTATAGHDGQGSS